MVDDTRRGPVRARDLAVPFAGTPGPLDAITDVPGVEVGLVTLVEGDAVRTGVTAVLPAGRDGIGSACPAGWWSLNGNGEMTGTTWISETGGLSSPVLLTNTHAVGPVHRGVVDWVVANRPELATAWLLPVVAETWDGYLNDINASTVRPEHAGQAIDAATAGPVAEGNVGGGTGMNCYAFKGGTGTASRVVTHAGQRYTVGVLLQANFGDRHELTVAGVPLGDLDVPDPMGTTPWFTDDLAAAGSPVPQRSSAPGGAGSVIVLVATDAPLLPGQCTALARRVPMGLARTGTTGGHFSGDIFLAWSTASPGALDSRFPVGAPGEDALRSLDFVPWGHLDPFYAAVVQAVEEAVVNALVAARDLTGRSGHVSHALPHDLLVERLTGAGRLTGAVPPR